MGYMELIRKSKAHLAGKQADISTADVFSSGALWMHEQLNGLSGEEKTFNAGINYTFYGLLKYGLSLAAFSIAAILLFRLNVFLVPAAAIVFYLFEVQFLFLFPLLIDGVENPILVSIQQTWKTGVIRALITVMPVAAFMLIGLLRLKDPFRNWYIGCMAILIWYHDEVRNRV